MTNGIETFYEKYLQELFKFSPVQSSPEIFHIFKIPLYSIPIPSFLRLK